MLFVTNLDDSGPGSLREALLTPGPRTVVFRVSGVVELKKHIFITDPTGRPRQITSEGNNVQPSWVAQIQ